MKLYETYSCYSGIDHIIVPSYAYDRLRSRVYAFPLSNLGSFGVDDWRPGFELVAGCSYELFCLLIGYI